MKKGYEKPVVEVLVYTSEMVLGLSTNEGTFGWDGEADEEF